jgi:CheY-like chemotaxis protein
MADSFSQTALGKAEFAAKPGKLTTGLKTLLGLIGDKTTLDDLKRKLPQVPVEKLTPALNKLVADGFLTRHIEAPPAPLDNDLDFTRFISRPVKEPTLQKRLEAEATIASIKVSLKTAGFHVNIINRPASRVAPHAGGDKHTILLIDADDSNAIVMTRGLLLAKFDTRTAGTREEIVKELNKKPPADAIFMDIALPGISGLELLGRMRQHPVYKTTPIVVTAVTQERDDVVAALSYGASGYMSKPFRPEDLVASAKAVLGL